MLREERDVVLPLAQRRRADGDDVQAIEEILAEAAGADFLGEVLVRRGDHAHVDLDDGGRADRLDFPFLQHAQHLGLRAQRHVADLVEEDRAAVRGDELAGLFADRAGERSLLMPEQLRLDQLLGDGRAVDLDERLRGARGAAMDFARHELLAGARFAGDEDRGFRRRGQLDLRLELLHRRRLADELVVARFALAQLADFLLELLLPDGVADGEQQLVAVQRLLEEIERAALRALDGGGDVAVAGDHDHRRRHVLLFQILEDFDAVEHGHLDVEEDGVVRRGGARGLVDAVLPGARLVDAVALVLQRHPDRFADRSFIVNDKNSERHSSTSLVHESGQLYGGRFRDSCAA